MIIKDRRIADKDLHNAYQLAYYENQYKPNMQPTETPYILRHIDKMIRYANLEKTHAILEVGAGLGRCSLPLLARGYKLTCIDISHKMLEALKMKTDGYDVRVRTMDIAAADMQLADKFDRIIGFFTLHHVHDIAACFRNLAQIAKPGAVIAFCEPRAYNPLFYVQIAVTKNMTWKGDKGIVNMRPSYVLSAMEKAGFCDLRSISYGFFPSFLTNTTPGEKIEDALEKIPALRWAHAFQIFLCRMPVP
ncbi:MAG: class I SAM-dependent methyltransferase [Candidatus Omnitrophota bacterium]